jgi:hypothetical protein
VIRSGAVDRNEIAVWSDGYEGRILQWSGDTWEAFDYRNFRHTYSDPQALNLADLRALRTRFDVPPELLSDDQLTVSAPQLLRNLKAKSA